MHLVILDCSPGIPKMAKCSRSKNSLVHPKLLRNASKPDDMINIINREDQALFLALRKTLGLIEALRSKFWIFFFEIEISLSPRVCT